MFAVATCGEQPRAQTAEDVVRAQGGAVRILRVRDGEEIGEEIMMGDLARAKVVYLGERHDRATDHAMQHRILRDLYSRDPSLGIGLEMLQTPSQPVLSQWVNGDLDEMALRRDAEWDTRWGHDFALYRPILEFIRARHVRAYALNAPQEITRVVARDGIEALDEEQRASLPTLNTGDVMHRGLVMGALGEHAGEMSDERLERMYTAQVIWDETMARSVVEAMEGEDAPPRLIVLAGRLHVQGGLGIPQRAALAEAQPYRIVLAVDEDSDEIESLLHADPPSADYLWVVDAGDEIE